MLRAARRGDRGARERLISTQLGLVRSVASRYRDLGLPFDDLVQEGALGLLEAVDHYDPGRGPAFESYARFRVRRAIRNALTDRARLIRLPKQVVERRRAIESEDARLSAATNGRAPTPLQLAAATGLSIAAVLEARAAPAEPISLDEPVLPDGSTLRTVIADPAASDPERRVLEREQAERLYAALAKLPERERHIVAGHWGLRDLPRSISELAEELGLSPRRTQTIGRHALDELRNTLEPAGLRDEGSVLASRDLRKRDERPAPVLGDHTIDKGGRDGSRYPGMLQVAQ